ncbi:MAG TPA: hypothetical protein VM010_03765 [Chitinophagaceae bacterium]|nr:hypothetical protein [Chitinophagaceae bacterium]
MLLCSAATVAVAQDTLPRFSVTNAGANRVIIGWVNNLGAMRQISVQRSHDSLVNYKTILSVADPNAVQNGFADTKAPNDHMWYRLFYVLGNGSYYFTVARQPRIDTTRSAAIEPPAGAPPTPKKDSVLIKNPGFVPSFYVYTNNAGDVFINLPDADKKDYSLKFYDERNAFLFDIKSLKEPALTLDKTNFYHAGWFFFELYNNEKLVERHKFYITRPATFYR